MTPAERRRLAAELRAVCMRVSRRARFQNAGLLAPHKASVLGKLEGTVRTPRELAEIECVSAPSMTRTVNDLVEQGLVRREPDPDDGRQVRLHLTDQGLSMLRETRKVRDEWMLERIRTLTDEECAVLSQAEEILSRVVAR